MEQLFNKAWRKQSSWLWLLLPFAFLYCIISNLQKKLYQLGLKKVYYSNVPVIVIGNITVGGSGKTPLIICLVRFLQQQGIKVGVISRGYGGDTKQMPLIVTPQSMPTQVGDEPCLIVQSTNVPMAVCPNRGQAIDLLLKNFPAIQLILADDGLQHHALDRDENWIVVDSERGFGNQQLLPVGFLREPITRLFSNNTTVIFHQKDWKNSKMATIQNSLSKKNLPNNLFMKLIEQKIEPLFANKSRNIELLPKTFPKVIAMTGIGYPERFFQSLQKLGFKLEKIPLNDHHQFTLNDFNNLADLPIIVTSKDAVKIRLLLQDERQYQELINKIWVLPVVAELSETVYQNLSKQLAKLNIKGEI